MGLFVALKTCWVLVDEGEVFRLPLRQSGSAWVFVCAVTSASAFVLTGVAVGESSAYAAPNRAMSVDALARRLQQWVADPDPERNAQAVERVRQGVPPGAMVAFLVAVHAHPGPQYADIVNEATTYRRLGVRGHAFAAWASLGPQNAADAVARAADDPAQGIRRLALTLAKQHPSPATEEVVARLLARDTTLAAEATASEALVPDEPPPDTAPESTGSESTDAELVIIDDDDDDGQAQQDQEAPGA